MNKCNQCKCFNCLGEDKQTITVSIDTSNIQNQIDEAIRPIKEILHECVLAYLNITNK